MKHILLVTLFFATLLLGACQRMDPADVMSDITFVLEYPNSLHPTQMSYQLKYSNMNTRVTTTRNSIATPTYHDQLLRGLYTIYIDGAFILPSGETIHVRGVKRDRLFLDREETCGISLIVMP